MKYIKGDMLELFAKKKEALIVQQNNCTSLKLHKGSLAEKIANKLQCNPYTTRQRPGVFPNLAYPEHRNKMGEVVIYENDEAAKVACLFAQYRMGKANSSYYMNSNKTDEIYKTTPDTYEDRLRAFEQCLNVLSEKLQSRPDISVVVFPFSIGCGMAGGDWSKYEPLIRNFAKKHNVVICKI